MTIACLSIYCSRGQMWCGVVLCVCAGFGGVSEREGRPTMGRTLFAGLLCRRSVPTHILQQLHNSMSSICCSRCTLEAFTPTWRRVAYSPQCAGRRPAPRAQILLCSDARSPGRMLLMQSLKHCVAEAGAPGASKVRGCVHSCARCMGAKHVRCFCLHADALHEGFWSVPLSAKNT